MEVLEPRSDDFAACAGDSDNAEMAATATDEETSSGTQLWEWAGSRCFVGLFTLRSAGGTKQGGAATTVHYEARVTIPAAYPALHPRVRLERVAKPAEGSAAAGDAGSGHQPWAIASATTAEAALLRSIERSLASAAAGGTDPLLAIASRGSTTPGACLGFVRPAAAQN